MPPEPLATDPVKLHMIAAVGRRGELGRGNDLLFRLKTDMANFRKLTAGKPVIMGRKTWESLPKRPLPGRPNIIVTRNADFLAPNAFVFSSLAVGLSAARAMAQRLGLHEACVIGGADIYAAALPFADVITLTDVDAEREADVFFPRINPGEWVERSRVSHKADAENDADFVIRELHRKH